MRSKLVLSKQPVSFGEDLLFMASLTVCSVIVAVGGASASYPGNHRRVAEGAGSVALPGAHLLISGHHATDSRRGTTFPNCRQKLERSHETLRQGP